MAPAGETRAPPFLRLSDLCLHPLYRLLTGGGFGHFLGVCFLGYGVSALIERDTPEPRSNIIGKFGVDVSVGSAGVGPARSVVAGAEEVRGLFPTFKIVVGQWFWVESPSNFGPMTGFKAGLGAVVRDEAPRTSVLLEFESLYVTVHG